LFERGARRAAAPKTASGQRRGSKAAQISSALEVSRDLRKYAAQLRGAKAHAALRPTVTVEPVCFQRFRGGPLFG
jgi:hypothetical protein